MFAEDLVLNGSAAAAAAVDADRRTGTFIDSLLSKSRDSASSINNSLRWELRGGFCFSSRSPLSEAGRVVFVPLVVVAVVVAVTAVAIRCPLISLRTITFFGCTLAPFSVVVLTGTVEIKFSTTSSLVTGQAVADDEVVDSVVVIAVVVGMAFVVLRLMTPPLLLLLLLVRSS